MKKFEFNRMSWRKRRKWKYGTPFPHQPHVLSTVASHTHTHIWTAL